MLGCTRKSRVEATAGPATMASIRSSFNGRAGQAVLTTSFDCGGSSGEVELNSREDAEHLLSEKMRWKNMNDYKGKSDHMIEYIKRLRTCVRWYMELEDGYLLEQEELRNILKAEQRRHAEIDSEMRSRIDELNATIEELREQRETLEENFKREEANKLAAMKSYQEEKEARIATQNVHEALSEDIERTSQEVMQFIDQIKMLQETNRQLQEYNTSLQLYNGNLQADTVKNGETITKLQKDKNTLIETMANLRSKTSMLENQLGSHTSSQLEALRQTEELKKEICFHRSELQQVRDDRDHQFSEVQSLTAEVADCREVIEMFNKDFKNNMTKNCSLEELRSSQREQVQSRQHQFVTANEKLKGADLMNFEKLSEYEDQKRMVKELQNRIADAEQQILESEKLRKKLHNTVMELKGNVRVFCRVRPLLHDNDCTGQERTIISYPTSIEFLGRGIDLMHNEQKHSFTFDKAFNHETSQEAVFTEISELVQSALDGYKVCIFAYGQTGSGKTYTMMGNPKATEQKGLIPRSLEQIFLTIQSLQSQGWQYEMQASMLEIYNEKIHDLLLPSHLGSFDSNGVLNKQHTIKHDPNGNTHVSDLTIINVHSIKEVSYLLQLSAQSRSVGRTQMNEQSSRSHFVFTLRISGVNESTDQHVQGVLNLIDLAGSERLKQSGSTGDRLKETQAINKSLSALNDVISAIVKREEHVPFRNSKLTYLLQPSLGGDSKTLMFVNISPETTSVGESICSLRFAARVNSCHIGIPRRLTQARSLTSRLSFG